MATLHFDGADDWLRGTGQGAMNGAITLAVLHRRTGAYAGHYSALIGGATSANAKSFMLAYDQEASPENFTLYDTGVNAYNVTTIPDSSTDWWLVVYTKAVGVATGRWHIYNITTGAAAIHENGVNTNSNFPSVLGGYLKVGNYDLTPGNPGSAEEDFLGDIGLVGWWQGTALSDAQCNELVANSKTSDWANNSAGAPSSLTELTASTPTDLQGLVTWVTTGTTLTGPDPTGWTFDGLGGGGVGTFDEAGVTFDDADSQFDNFVGGVAPTPQAGTDSFTLTEAAILTQTRQISVSDSGALSEARTLENQFSRTDSFALSEARALGVSIDQIDTFTLSEVSGLAIIENKLGSDTFALTGEVPTVTTLDLKLGSDTFNLSESRTLAISSAVSDTAALTEAAALAAGLSASDAAALTEAVLLSTLDSKSASDSFAVTEALALQAGFSQADAAALAEQSQVAAAVAAADSGALSEARTLSAALAVSDTSALSEAIALLSFDAKTGSDSFALSEARTLSAQFSVSDAAALSEAVSIAASVAAVDLATLTEAFIGGQMVQKAVSDSFALSEVAAAVRTAQLSVADSATLSEALTLTAQIARSDNLSLSESVSLVQLILKTGVDSGTLSEDASVVIQVGSPYTHSLPPQFARGSHHAEALIKAAAAETGTAGHAALVIGAHSARLVVFAAQTGLVVVDAEADAEGGYEGDATLT